MSTAICTLLEGDYHLGLGVLVSSLCRNGFHGKVLAGYRGALPAWAEGFTGSGLKDKTLVVSSKVSLTFLEIRTDDHFTNYKPRFMLDLLDQFSADVTTLVYTDPDIVFDTPWAYFEEIISSELVLCEDVSSPLGRNDPRRFGWKNYFPEMIFPSRDDVYVNGGFVSVPRRMRSFLEKWNDVTDRILENLGGRNIVGHGGVDAFSGQTISDYGYAGCFSKTDQDALNIALDLFGNESAMILGRSAMGFGGARAIIPHAIGSSKPWRRQYLVESLLGKPPSAVDKAFWRYAGGGPIALFPKLDLFRTGILVNVAALIGRFCRKPC